MRNHMIAALAAAALLSAIPTIGAHANETLFGDGRYTFSLSIEPNGFSSTATAFNIPYSMGVSAGSPNTDFFQLGPNGDRIRWQSSTVNTAGNYVSVETGGASAPYTSATEQSAAPYLKLNQMGSGSTSAFMTFTTRNAADTGWVVETQKSLSVLWGSVGAADRLEFVQTGYTAALRGSDILAAASALGFTGNNNSYYVTINAVGANGYRAVNAYAGAAGNTFEFAPLSYDSQVTAVNAVLFPPPVVDDTPVGAPAPVLGASPVGGMLGLGLLGLVGLGRRRTTTGAARLAA